MTASMSSRLPPRTPNCVVRFILCRHGETALNARHILQGSGMNPPLNEAGESQAILLSQRLASAPLDLIVSSHLLVCIYGPLSLLPDTFFFKKLPK
ncbi:hypothetical protein HMI56_005776 [Coelomomyces lativittatus]|nr:hypothetical protein HMI56_005776 [Coelomomyces lativittatus]